MNISALHPYLRTKSDTIALIQLLEKLEKEIFKEPFDFSKILKTKAPYELSAVIQKLITEANIKVSNRNALQKLLTEINNQVATLPVVHIIVPLSPTENHLKIMHDWFFQNYKKTVILDISVDPSLIGGCVVSFGGRANDYSLKNRIEQMQTSD